MSKTGVPTVTYPPDQLRQIAVLRAAYTLCAGSGDHVLELSLLVRIAEITSGY
jgi:hypothetical protein